MRTSDMTNANAPIRENSARAGAEKAGAKALDREQAFERRGA